MDASYDNTAALVVLPPASGGRLQDQSIRSWLAKSELQREPRRQELLARIVSVLGLPYPDEGIAALRMWGQTGDRPTVWIAAADPVYLEPRLDRLCLHDLGEASVPPSELRALFDHLQATLAGEDGAGFVQLGARGYLSSSVPIATARVPAYVVDQGAPSQFLPGGEGTGQFRNLLSEIEMSLHDHAVNQRRVEAGQRPVNSLWIWGGGLAPQRSPRPQPRLFANEPELLGYWDSANAVAELWPGDIEDCIDASDSGFVAVAPHSQDDPDYLSDCLSKLQAALHAKSFSRLTILFRDGLRADIDRSQRLKFWRRDSKLLD